MNKSTNDFISFIEAYDTGELQITDNISYKIKDVKNKNDEYFHGKFENPYDGSFKKIFYNIGFIIFRSIFQVIVKTLGTKDIQIRSLNGKGVEALALFRLAIKSYLNRIKFGTFLNDLCYFLKDGTTYVKIVDGEPKIVNAHNIVVPPYGGSIQETGVAEKCIYSWGDMLSYKEDWKEHWSKIEELKKIMDKNQVRDFIVYEFWSQHEFDGKIHKGCIKFLDMSLTEPHDRQRTQQSTEWEPWFELDRFKTIHKKKRTSKRRRQKLGDYEELYPYKELHFIKVPGRTLAFSIFELISGIQEAYNRKMNLNDKKDILDLMGIFKHKKSNTSPSVAQQLLDNIQSGKVIEMELDEDIERLMIDSKVADLLNNTERLFDIARQIVGVTAGGTGVDMPASTTATVGVLNKQTQQTTYDYAAEQVALFLTELFDDFYLETILDELDQEEINAIVGDAEELAELDQYFVSQMINRRMIAVKMATGMQGVFLGEIEDEGEMTIEEIAKQIDPMQVVPVMNDEEYEMILQQFTQALAEKGDMRWADIKKSFLKNLNYSFEFYVNNESFDKNVKIQNLMSLRQNPNMSGERIDMAILDLMGENSKHFMKTDEEKAQEQQMAMLEMTGGQMTPGQEFAKANPMTPNQ